MSRTVLILLFILCGCSKQHKNHEEIMKKHTEERLKLVRDNHDKALENIKEMERKYMERWNKEDKRLRGE